MAYEQYIIKVHYSYDLVNQSFCLQFKNFQHIFVFVLLSAVYFVLRFNAYIHIYFQSTFIIGITCLSRLIHNVRNSHAVTTVNTCMTNQFFIFCLLTALLLLVSLVSFMRPFVIIKNLVVRVIGYFSCRLGRRLFGKFNDHILCRPVRPIDWISCYHLALDVRLVSGCWTDSCLVWIS